MGTLSKTHLKKLISKSKTKEAIEGLLSITSLSECINNELILLSGRFNKNENGKLMNTSTNEIYKTEVAQINTALLHIIDKLPERKDINYSEVKNEKDFKNDIVKVELKINTNFNDFTKNDQDDLKKAISLLLGLDGDIDIKFRKGSVIAEFCLPQNLAERLKELIESGKFSDYDVIDFKINESNSKKPLDKQLKRNHSSTKQRRILLIDLLNSFSPRELKGFIEFVNSEYHNKNKKTIVLLNFLVKNVIYITEFTELLQAKAFNKIFQIKNQPINKLSNPQKTQLNRTMSLLAKLVEEFLYIDMLKYDKSENIKTRLLIKQLQEKEQNIYIERIINKQQKKLDGIVAKSIENYEESYHLKKLYFKNPRYYRYYESIFNELNNNIDIIYIIKKCRLYIDWLYFKLTNPLTINFIFKDIKQLIKNYSAIPIINAYHITSSLLETNDLSYYIKLKELLYENIQYLPLDDLRLFCNSAINFCKEKVREGQDSYNEDMFEFFKIMDDNNLLTIENIPINVGLLSDIIKVSSKTGKYSHAYEIIEKYISFVKAEDRDSVYHFNLGIIEYNQANFKKALSHFAKVDKLNYKQDINLKMMMLKCHFELDVLYNEKTIQIMRAMRIMIVRNAKLGTRMRTSYLNFIKVLFRSYKMKHKTKQTLSDTKTKNLDSMLENLWLSN